MCNELFFQFLASHRTHGFRGHAPFPILGVTGELDSVSWQHQSLGVASDKWWERSAGVVSLQSRGHPRRDAASAFKFAPLKTSCVDRRRGL